MCRCLLGTEFFSLKTPRSVLLRTMRSLLSHQRQGSLPVIKQRSARASTREKQGRLQSYMFRLALNFVEYILRYMTMETKESDVFIFSITSFICIVGIAGNMIILIIRKKNKRYLALNKSQLHIGHLA